MKLHLPTGLRAALITALTAVGFTSFSTGTIAATAAGVLVAGQQAWADATLLTLESIQGKMTVTDGKGSLTAGNSHFLWAEEPTTLTSWELAFDLKETRTLGTYDLFGTNRTDGAGGDVLKTTAEGGITLIAGGITKSTAGNLVVQDTNVKVVLRYEAKCDEDGTSLNSGLYTLTVGEGEAITIDVTNDNNSVFRENAGTKIWTNGGKEQFYNITLTKLDDIIVKVPADVWIGTDGSNTWIAENFEPQYSAGHDVKFTADRGTKTVVVNSAIEAGKMTVTGAAYTFNIQGGASLKTQGFTLSGTGASATLDGSGKYELNSGVDTMGGMAFAGTWTGTVKLSNITTQQLDLNNYGTAKSVVEIDGWSKYLKDANDYVYNPKLRLSGAGMTIQDGYSNRSYIFAGGVEGEGDFKLGITTGANNQTYIFTGDVSSWTGSYESQKNKTTTLKFYDKATKMGAAIKQTSGVINIEVGDGTNVFTTAFDQAVTATALTIKDKATATLKGASNIVNVTGAGSLIVNAGANTVTFTGDANVISNTIDLTSGTLDISGAVLDVSGISGSGMETSYSDGQNEGNGFATVSGTVDVVNINGGTLTRGAVQVKYNGASYTMDENGDIAMSGSKSLTTFYVNESGTTESLQNAWNKSEKDGTNQLTTVILKDGTKLAADAAVALTTLTVDTDASAEVALSKDLSVGTLTITTDDEVLTLSGTGNMTVGALTGAGDLAYGSSGVMTLNGSNTGFTGDVTINAGIVKIGNQKALGEHNNGASQAKTITIAAGGTLDLNGIGDANFTYTMAGGKLTNSGGDLSTNLSQAVGLVLEDDSFVEAFSGKQHWLRARGGNATTLTLAGNTLIKTGDGTFGVFRCTVDAGTIEVRDGEFKFETDGSTAANITFNGGTVSGSMKLSGNITLKALQKASTSAAINANGHAITLDGTDELTLTGNITGATTITKTGTGTAVLSGTVGTSAEVGVIVNEGTLKATKAGALGSGGITVATGATLDLAVGNALGSTQTVANSGNVLIHNTLTSGKIDGGTLTLAGDFPVIGGGLEDVGGSTATGNGFSKGGTLHIVENRDQQLAHITSIIHGAQTYTLANVSTDGNITMSGEDWTTYQLKAANEDQPTIQEIMDYADEKGEDTGVLKQIVVTGEDLGIVNDSTTFKTSMLSGDQLDSFDIAMVNGSVLTMDADLAGGLVMGAATATDAATVVLEKDAEIGVSLFIYPFAEGGIGTLTVKGKYTLTTPLFGTMGGKLVLQDGATLATPAFAIEQGDSVTVKDTAALSLGDDNIRIQSVDGTKDASLTNVDGDAYDLNNAGHTLKDARITISYSDAAHDFGHTISGAVALVNDGTSSVRDINAANTAYAELHAQKGDIYLSNKTSGVSVNNLKVDTGRTVSMLQSDNIITVTGEASFGEGAKVSSALTMANGSTLEGKPASLESHALVLGAAAGDKLNIGDTLWGVLSGLEPEGTASLFTNVNALTLAGQGYAGPVDLTTIFSREGLNANKYSLSYDNDTVIVTRNKDNDRYWKGGSDTWDYSHEYWTDEDGGSNYVAFQEGYSAYFTNATNGTVTLDTNITAASITVSGADYTFAPNSHTLTVTDSVTVTGAHTATFNMALNGAEKLKLTAKEGGTLVLNQGATVKTAEIGSGSTMRVAASKSLTAGSVTNNGTLEVNGTGAVASLTLGAGSSVSGSGTLTVSGTTTVGGAATLTGSLTTGTLTGGPLTVNSGKLTLANGSLDGVQFSGTSSLTASSTIILNGALGNNGDLTLKGTYDASNLGASKSDSKYVEGGSTDNGFEQARLTLTIVDGGTTSASGATILYRDRTLTVEANGKVTFDGDIDYTKFYVNTGTENASKALGNPNQRLGTFELKTGTKLLADRDFDISMVNAAGAATLEIANGHKVTSNGQTKPLTLTGSGTYSLNDGVSTLGVTIGNASQWTGTVAFSEAVLNGLSADAYNTASKVSLTGVTGSLGSTPIGAAVILNKGTGDWGFGQTATGTQVVTLNGAITGDGNLGVKSGTEDSTFNLNGDINSWNGNFIVATDADTTLNLGGSGAKTVNGTVSGTNLEVNVNADTTFSGALNVEKLTVGNSKKATLEADSTVNEVSALSGSTLKVDDGKKLTVTSNVVPGGLVLGVDSSIELVDDAYMRGEGNYAYYGGTVANGTDREQAMGFNNADITVTGTTLGVNGGSGFTVDNKLVNATLAVENGLPSTVILNNVLDSLEVAGNLEIGPSGLLKVANGSSKQTLNISGYTTLTLADSTTLDADLTLNNGATLKLDYNMSSPVATSLESGTLTLASDLTLSGDLYAQIKGMEDTGSFVNLFTGVGALTLGDSAYSEPVKAQLYFSNLADLGDKGDYWLEYNANTDIVSIRFEATTAHTLTWNGTEDEHSWVQDDETVTDWLEGSPAAPAYFQEGDNAKFTVDATVKTVTIEDDITARNITINSPELYTFETAADHSITAQKFEMTGHDGLAKTGKGKLTLDVIGDVSLTDSLLSVQEGSVEIGTDAKSGKLSLQASALEIAEGTAFSVATIEGDVTSSIELAGTMTVSEGTVSNLDATEGSTLKIADLGQTTAGTLSVKTDTTLYGFENGGTLDLGNKTLNLMEKTEQGGNVIANKLNLAQNGNVFNALETNRVTYACDSTGSGILDAEAPNLVVDSIAPTMVIPSIALDVTETMGDGGSLAAINRLGDEVTYTLIHAEEQTLDATDFMLVDEALLIQNGLLHAESGLWSDGNNLNLTVGGLDLTWYTSNDETEWGYQVVSGGVLTDGANTLNGVQHVVVDSSRTVDVTGVGSEPGLRVRNLAGLDGRTITFSGEEGDTVNLITTEETASNVNLVAQNITVKVGLDELDAMDPVDYKDLRVGNVDLNGSTLAVHAYEDLDAAFTVNSLSGDGNSMLKGRVIVEGKGGAYRGGYENAYVILHENAEQLLYAGKGLTVAGLGAAKLAYVGPEAHMDGIEGINMTVTLNDPKQDNSGATLVLDKPSWLVDGTIISGMSAINSAATLDTAGAPNLVQAAGLNLDGTTIILNQDAVDDSVMAMAVNGNGKTKDLYLAHLGAEDSNTDRVLLNGYLYNKYYQNARLQGGKLLVDRRNAFFTEDVVRPTTVNGRAGSGMLDDALLEINPQATNPQGDLAAVMTALETNAVANPDRVAAAVAGASAAALGHAFNNDVQRQLRAIRNRTTTMGLAECTTHEGLPYVNAWVNAEGDYRKLDADGTLAGYTLSSWGGTIGCDVDLTGRLTVGAAFTVLHGEFTSHSADMCEGDLDRDYVSLFARYGYRAWTHTFVATLGFAKSKVDRTVNYGTGSYTTRGDSDGNAFGFLYEVGYTKALNEDASTCLQPIFNVNYRHSSLGGYTEKGSDAALSVGSADMDAVTFGLGARLQSIVGTSVYNRATLFEGRVLAKLDAGDRDCTTNSSLIGVSAKRSVKSAEVGAFGVEVGAGLTIPVGETGGSIFMDVTGDFRSGYTEFNGTVGYRFSF